MKNIFLSCLVTLISIASQNTMAHKMAFLGTVEESMQARADFIFEAQNEIRAQYFTVEDDSLAKASLALIREAVLKNPKLKVKIIVDELHNLLLDKTMAAFLKSSPNIEFKVYNWFRIYAPYRYTYRMHDKALIIDENALISGGRNVASGYYGFGKNEKDGKLAPIYEDTDALILESSAITQAKVYFDQLWESPFVRPAKLGNYDETFFQEGFCQNTVAYANAAFGKSDNIENEIKYCQAGINNKLQCIDIENKWFDDFIDRYENNKTSIKYKSKSENVKKWYSIAANVADIKYLFDSPVKQSSTLKKPVDNIGVQLYEAVKKANSFVTIVTPYFTVTPEHEALFEYLHKKGVSVTVITNGDTSNDVPGVHVAYLKTRPLALKWNVKIREYNGPDTLHAKVVGIDGKTIFIGSYNWDFRSQNLNRETGILATLEQVDGAKTIDLGANILFKFDRLMSRSTPIGQPKVLNTDVGSEGHKLDAATLQKLADQIKEANNLNIFKKLINLIIIKQQ